MDDTTLTIDADNPKYRHFTSGDRLLEYTLEVGEITVDWLNGKDAASMMKAILAADGRGIIKISGYVTDKLGGVSNTPAFWQSNGSEVQRRVDSHGRKD